MLTCKELTELTTSYTEGALDSATRGSVEAHLAGCPGCRALLEQLSFTAQVLRALPTPEVTPAARDAALRHFGAWKAAQATERATGPASDRSEVRPGLGTTGTTGTTGTMPGRDGAGRRAWASPLALIAVMALLVLVARQPSLSPRDWAIAGALALAAIGVAALARRLTAPFAAAAVSAALVAALVRGGAGSWSLLGGLECLATEAATAAGLALVGWLAARRKGEPAELGVWAVAGALAGDAALHVTCHEHGSLAHLLVFHVGGVLAVAALAAWSARRPVAATAGR